MTKDIRKALRAELEVQNMTQAELAERSGVRQDYVSKILRGERVSVPSEFQRILDELGLELVVREKLKDNRAEWKAWK